MLPSFDPKTYRDVLKDLTWWAGIVLLPVFVVVRLLLPAAVTGWIDGVSSQLPATGIVAWPVLSFVIAVVFVYLFKIHDKYDSVVIGWRERFDVDYILPLLIQPFADRFDPRFLSAAKEQRRQSMYRLFYYFAPNLNPRIDQNLVARFYQRVTEYWILVLNEIALIVVAFVMVSSALYVWGTGGHVEGYAVGLLAVLILALVNRGLMRATLPAVKRATEDELDAIIEGHRVDLEARVADLHKRFGLTYPRP